VTVLGGEDRQEALKAGAQLGAIVAESRDIARDLVNRPPNEINPPALAERARDLSQQHGLTCDVLDEAAMKELGMGSFLGVAAGSRQPPQLIVMRYGDDSAPVHLALVGKGLTFDSGGLSLKTHEGMETMKTDMSGAAAVIAGMAAVARLAPSGLAVTGYVGATENMPDGNAMRPGDILTAMNGKTIEVLNTDAEGRLVLADVLAYAVRQGSTHIVDFATLTGAATVALGSAASLATGKPMDWVEQVVEAADGGFDRAWPMPQYREYRQAMDSEVADLKNTGVRGGGALNAAAFLSEFVEDVPWTHLDIAGTAFSRESRPYQPGGATGVGVGAIVSLVRTLAQGA
jgi:leucyl aminopeptidase